MSKYPPMRLDDKLRFRKHKGKRLWEVMDIDIDYVGWIIENTDTVLDNEAYDTYRRRKRGDPR